ncbi:hypothetical protein ANANG_G00292180 [Anguilla anguilla]|uniref:histone acetyltransferase n=1 Tax=Anguilla anguilla TaxID=7936 RepID=A0A9D3LK88_ANGAN|nr:hypothetical protein ANANG_G00292180 [Anguilla anguilla]
MEQNNDQAPGNKAESAQATRHLSIQRCIQSLVHACQCRNASCSLASCQKVKRVVQHTKGCKRKTNGGCPICKQLIALCCYHAKHCQENKCPVPFCLNIKHKLRQQQLQHRLQQAQMLRRRMASMQNPSSDQRVNMEQNNDQAPGNKAESAQATRRLSIQRCIQSLHTKGCKRKTNGGCPICKQLIALCCYHAKHCQENKCPVPFCLNIKNKLRQQQLQQLQHRLQQAQMLRRRMASMQNPRSNRQRA